MKSAWDSHSCQMGLWWHGKGMWCTCSRKIQPTLTLEGTLLVSRTTPPPPPGSRLVPGDPSKVHLHDEICTQQLGFSFLCLVMPRTLLCHFLGAMSYPAPVSPDPAVDTHSLSQPSLDPNCTCTDCRWLSCLVSITPHSLL